MPSHCNFCTDTALERARNLFWKKGYAATSIQDLERELGIKRSSIYNTFGGKRQLYDRTLRDYQALNQQLLRERLLSGGSVRTALTTLFAQATGLGEEDLPRGCYIVNAGSELAAVDAEMLDFVSGNREAFVSILEEALVGAQERGELAPNADTRLSANYLFIWYNGIRVSTQSAMPAEELAASVQLGVSALPWT